MLFKLNVGLFNFLIPKNINKFLDSIMVFSLNKMSQCRVDSAHGMSTMLRISASLAATGFAEENDS